MKVAKARLPTFSHNPHLVSHYILLTLNNIHQITTCRLFDSIQFCVCLIPRNAPHFFVSTSDIPDNRCFTEWILSVKPRLLTDKLFILKYLSVKPHLFTDRLSILSQPYSVIRIIVAGRTVIAVIVKPGSGIARGELRSTLSRAGSCRCPAIINHSVSGNFRHITDITLTKKFKNCK